MPSRMERYAGSRLTRTAKNKELYDEIYENNEYPEAKKYTNVEGVVKTPITGNIDIERIKEIINNREEQTRSSQRRFKKIEDINEPVQEEVEEVKSYDIKDVLNKAKDDRPINTQEFHSLKNVEFNILRKLNINKGNNEEPEDELKELIDTITNTSKLNKIGDKELSLDLLDNLKSCNNTVIGSSDAIRKVLTEEKKTDEDEGEMDNSFYTKSMNLTSDLEGLKSGKKDNKTVVKIFIIISILVVIVVGIFIILKILGKL